LEKESSAKVKALIGELIIERASGAEPSDADLSLPPIAPVERVAPLSTKARAAFTTILREAWEAIRQNAAKLPQFNKVPPPLEEAAITLAIDFIEGAHEIEPGNRAKSTSERLGLDRHLLWQSAENFAARPDLALIHVVRLADLFKANDDQFVHLVAGYADKYYFSHKPRFSLRELAANLVAADHNAEDVARAIFSWPHENAAFLKFDGDDIWPYFAEHEAYLERVWRKKEDFAFVDDRKTAVIFKILALFPILPRRFSRLCWDTAFNGTKKERLLAQNALAREPGKEERISAAVSSGKAEHRAIAAEWLARLGYKDAIPALKRAALKEKQELTAGAIMAALETLGVPLDEFINMDGLIKEAKALLDKGIPKDLAWFNFDKLPDVRWAKTGKTVPKVILKWMILQSYKLGSPEPGPRLRQYASHFDRADAEEFGQIVLESWIARDTIPHSAEQAHEAAQKFAAQMAGYAVHLPQLNPGGVKDWYRQAYDEKLLEPVGSAQKEKGVLAVAGACCGTSAAPVVERYLKTYYGFRVHQCRALIRMLSWIDQPAAIQLLLSVSHRFRTAGIRKEAEACVNELAQRKNWTVAELADRTIPTAGFDHDLRLALDFGPRTFTATLDGEFSLVLRDDQGKVIKTLPAPRKDDDAERATAAKKALSAARKGIDTVLKLQKERLYEAMCTQRTWSFADWDQFLNKHSIVRHCCQRLVWCVIGEGEFQHTFRPLEDGTLTDTEDSAVNLAPEARICLAHESLLPATAIKNWRQHLVDYSVKPIFEQFGNRGNRLPEGKRGESKLDEFQGYLLEAFKLRGRLTKLGYTRGATGDGGWFCQYQKRFPSLGITATIEFSGNGLPEENRTVALTFLYFNRSAVDQESAFGDTENCLPLGEVPPVLLSECWHDMKVAAAEGTGFHPEWETKTTC
jgi:Domain of unknown function (DUF4132)